MVRKPHHFLYALQRHHTPKRRELSLSLYGHRNAGRYKDTRSRTYELPWRPEPEGWWAA